MKIFCYNFVFGLFFVIPIPLIKLIIDWSMDDEYYFLYDFDLLKLLFWNHLGLVRVSQ